VTGSLRVVAARRGTRTAIETLRQEGLARCSRPLRVPADPDAVRLVVSQLGPGFVRGDRFETDVDVGDDASLVLAAQSATRILGRGLPSTFAARYRVGRNARLVLAGEPTIGYAGATHRSVVRVDLADGASFASVDAFAPHEAFARVSSSLRVEIDGRLALHDVLVLAPETIRTALGTAFYLRAGIAADDTDALVALADEAARRASASGAMRIGVGSPAAGGIALRAVGAHVRDVRDALAAIVDLVRDRDRRVPRSFATYVAVSTSSSHVSRPRLA
jgi:urease accessory protein UreH